MVIPNNSIKSNQANINAHNVETTKNGSFKISGDVGIELDDLKLFSDEIDYNEKLQVFTMKKGGVIISPQLKIKSDYLVLNAKNKTGTLTDIIYSIGNKNNNGKAKSVDIDFNSKTIFHSASFSSCAVKDPEWRVETKKIVIDHKNNVSELHDIILVLGELPVLYIPYLNFAISGRKSGFLLPRFSQSEVYGGYFTVPYYYNIEPESDWSIVPYIFFNTGVLFHNEWRTILPGGMLTNKLSIIKDDNDERAEGLPNDRWLNTLSIKTGNSNRHFNTTLNEYSDTRFPYDFDNPHNFGNRFQFTNSFTYRELNEYFVFNVSATDNEIVDGLSNQIQETNNSRIDPTISFSSRNWKIGNSFDFLFNTGYSRLVSFETEGNDTPSVSKRMYAHYGFSADPWISATSQFEFRFLTIERDIDNVLFTQNLSHVAIHGYTINSDGNTVSKVSVAYSNLTFVDDASRSNDDSALLPPSYSSFFNPIITSGVSRAYGNEKITFGTESQFTDLESDDSWIRVRFAVQHLNRLSTFNTTNDTLGLISLETYSEGRNYNGLLLSNTLEGAGIHRIVLFGRNEINQISSIGWYVSSQSNGERNILFSTKAGISDKWYIEHTSHYNLNSNKILNDNTVIGYSSCCLSFSFEIRSENQFIGGLTRSFNFNFNLINLIEADNSSFFGKIDEWFH